MGPARVLGRLGEPRHHRPKERHGQGRAGRACIRHLDRLRNIGKLNEGVNWGLLGALANTAFSTGAGGVTGTVKIDVVDYERPPAIAEDSPDNRIIAVAWHLKENGLPAVFVTK